ncbi:muconolactone Delta-isomerase [Pseudomonas oryzihabitans]|uniref:muconolactone Delta-isomerase n=1 Tax=Pseudomonas oryzihabitans TaxID=47885 RepID=UPI0011A90DF6|nr:muconolactone Delta-isomerase [Pseudomonas psychrotolerans]
MLFMVRMTVKLPHDLPASESTRLKQAEKELAQELQRQGTWRHLWRIAGLYANVSVFDVADAQALHDTLLQLPLYPYLEIEVTALCRHPSSIHDDDR